MSFGLYYEPERGNITPKLIPVNSSQRIIKQCPLQEKKNNENTDCPCRYSDGQQKYLMLEK